MQQNPILSIVSIVARNPVCYIEYVKAYPNNTQEMILISQVHDNIIKSYQVDFENEQLRLRTEYSYVDKVNENTDIIFESYLAHLFENEQKDSIIFDIEECTPTLFYEQNQELIEKNRNYCWPISYHTTNTKKELVKFIHKNGYKVFEISSSYGLCGWVLAKDMQVFIAKV
ncbi:TPA: hypothetical protein ACSY4C_00310 [Listeria monocytogenes]